MLTNEHWVAEAFVREPAARVQKRHASRPASCPDASTRDPRQSRTRRNFFNESSGRRQGVDETLQPFADVARLGLAQVFNFLEREQCLADLGNPVLQQQMFLGPPGEPLLDFRKRAKGRR